MDETRIDPREIISVNYFNGDNKIGCTLNYPLGGDIKEESYICGMGSDGNICISRTFGEELFPSKKGNLLSVLKEVISLEISRLKKINPSYIIIDNSTSSKN